MTLCKIVATCAAKESKKTPSKAPIQPVSPALAPLFRPLQIGALPLLPSRLVMAPLTRCRADPLTRVPTTKMVDYYRQRASAGLILTEATVVDPLGDGYQGTPGIWSDEQVEGWRRVTEAVHEAGGRIIMQLWHVGRISESEVYLQGRAPISASAVRAAGHVSLVRPKRPFSEPRALETAEMRPLVVDVFHRAAVNAKRAGFDGVEVHAGNGYLLDQFLQDSVNKRKDLYGGSVENRIRLLIEVVDAVAEVWGAGRIGVHLSPRGDYNDMGDSNPRKLFTKLARELGARRVAFLMLRERSGPDSLLAEIKVAFGGPVIANEAFTVEEAVRALETGVADAVGFGYDFIANPDLPERLANGAPLSPAPMESF